MIIAGNGNVAIGTNPTSNSLTSTYKLSVMGKIRAEEIKVYTGWADYVFEENYQIKTIEEVEKFIKAEGHLPGMPSSQEIEENEGVEVGEMLVKQQEKIEELFLYIIELEKKLQEVKSNN